MTDKLSLKFTFEKETKNTVRFAEVDEGRGTTVGTLYVQKHAYADLGSPTGVLVEIFPQDA